MFSLAMMGWLILSIYCSVKIYKKNGKATYDWHGWEKWDEWLAFSKWVPGFSITCVNSAYDTTSILSAFDRTNILSNRLIEALKTARGQWTIGKRCFLKPCSLGVIDFTGLSVQEFLFSVVNPC